MGFLDSFRKKPTLQEAPGPQINKTSYKNFLVKAVGFVASQGAARGSLSEPEYNLSEIKAASDSDSYIKMAMMKYSYMMFKAGYELKSDNEKAKEYLKMRFRIMSFATGIPMDILFQEVADDLVKYSNSFLIKSRVDKLMPGVQAKGIFNDKPIGGYSRVDPATMKIDRDKNGTIKKYQQKTDSGDEKNFQPTEVIHFYLDKDPNNAFGTPRIVAALEDVKLLRRIEGNIVTLIYRFSIPIYQWIIGLPEQGFQATDKEVIEAQKEIENMPLDGVIVTNEKTQIKAIGAEGQALDASRYLTYFEQRVFTALSVSQSQMGRGGSKQDADSMESQAHDVVKYIQRTMSIFAENMLLNELLLEGGFNPIFNEQDIVHFEFNEISLETKVKLENHELLKYQSNLITFEESRIALGKNPVVDESRLYANFIESKVALEQIQAKTDGAMDIARLSAQAAGGVGGNGKQQSAKPTKAASTNNRPTNQHGTTSAKIKEGLDMTEGFEAEEAKAKVIKNVSKHKKTYASLYKKYDMLRNDIADADADVDLLIPLAKNSMLADMRTYIQLSSFEGVQRAVKELSDSQGTHLLIPNLNIDLEDFYEEADNALKSLFKDVKTRIKTDGSPENVRAVFSTLEYRVRFMIEFVVPKVYWYSYVKTGAHFDIEKAYIKFNGSNDADDHPAEINPKAFSYEEIPAYHSFCDCEVSFKAGEKN